jgi:hypothetical protein
MNNKSNSSERPEAYPKPTETDKQLQNQPEYIDQEPNDFTKEISDVPADKQVRQNTPGEDE